MSGVSIATGVIATDALGGGQGRGLQSPGVLAQSAVPASVTGTTVETVLATIPIPAGAMGVNGALRITTLWSYTNSVNNKFLIARFGGSPLGLNHTLTTSALLYHQFTLQNRGTANSQLATAPITAAFGTATGVPGTAGIDSSQAQNLTLNGRLATPSETVTLEAYTVEILNP